jgi:hypothetical protein
VNPTLAEARADLHDVLLNGAGVVYDVEQPHEVDGPTWATVALDGLDATEQRWRVRLYVSILDDAEDSARTLDEALTDVEDALNANDKHTAGDWDVTLNEARGWWCAQAQVRRGREDF